MSVFKYEALDSQGISIKDEIEALSQQEAISKLRNKGYFPTKVSTPKQRKRTETIKTVKPKSHRAADGKVKSKALTRFTRQLSSLQDAGLPILRSLRLLEKQQRFGKFKKIIRSIADDIENGAMLSEAMSRYPGCFDRLLVSMVSAGETGGVLDLILRRLSECMEQNQKLKSRVKGAMVYPATVLIAAFVILLGLMKYVIPRFKEILIELGRDSLPPITEVVMGISEWIAYRYGWLYLISVPILAIIIVKFTRKFKNGRLIIDHVTLKIPVFGSLSRKVSVIRWARTLGTLISAGVPILEAIQVAKETAGNEFYSRMLARVHDSIRQGESFASPLQQSRAVDAILADMIAVGEETGDLDKMLLKVADDYDEEVETMVDSMMSLLEPIIIIFLGVVVLFIVLSIMLPIIPFISNGFGSV
jgi:type IV pilus assembly protein PilC